MDQPRTKPVAPRRRRASLSVRGTLILVLILGGLLGGTTRRATRQRRAVAAIEALGGEVRYDWHPRSRIDLIFPVLAIGQPPGPARLRRLLGDEYFQDVVDVAYPAPRFQGFPVPPPDAPRDGPEWRAAAEDARRRRVLREAWDRDQLACLEGLDRLETLHLGVRSLKPEGFARLGTLTSLKELGAGNLCMDAGGLARVARLSKLEMLDVALSLPDASPLAQLERLPALKHLRICKARYRVESLLESPRMADLPGEPVTDAWLARLGRLRSLTLLEASDCDQVTDAGMAELGGLTRLQFLMLGGFGGNGGVTRITDAGVAPLAKLRDLEHLDLSRAREVGDGALGHLSTLPRLEQLLLSSATRITDAGVAHLEGHPKLNWLRLDAAETLTEASVASLATMPALRALSLNVKSIPEAALPRLATFKSLQYLSLSGAKVRGKVLDAIAAANPGLQVQAERSPEGTDAPAPGPAPGDSGRITRSARIPD